MILNPLPAEFVLPGSPEGTPVDLISPIFAGDSVQHVDGQLYAVNEVAIVVDKNVLGAFEETKRIIKF